MFIIVSKQQARFNIQIQLIYAALTAQSNLQRWLYNFLDGRNFHGDAILFNIVFCKLYEPGKGIFQLHLLYTVNTFVCLIILFSMSPVLRTDSQ